MKFEDLLDENGQATRELDAWLYNHIETDKGVWPPDNVTLSLKDYTTGDSIDPIWELAKDYINEADIRLHSDYNSHGDTTCSFLWSSVDVISSYSRHNEQLAITEALFKAYQNES